MTESDCDHTSGAAVVGENNALVDEEIPRLTRVAGRQDHARIPIQTKSRRHPIPKMSATMKTIFLEAKPLKFQMRQRMRPGRSHLLLLFRSRKGRSSQLRNSRLDVFRWRVILPRPIFLSQEMLGLILEVLWRVFHILLLLSASSVHRRDRGPPRAKIYRRIEAALNQDRLVVHRWHSQQLHVPCGIPIPNTTTAQRNSNNPLPAIRIIPSS